MTPTEIAGLDIAWLAVDETDQIAVFITGGCTAVPDSAMEGIDEAERVALSLPEICGYELLIDVPDPSSYVRLASRGFFVFDWFEIGASDSVYSLAARPTVRAKLETLPSQVSALARRTKLKGVDFATTTDIEISESGVKAYSS